MNMPFVFIVSVIPDFDLLLSPFLDHRGPTHSLLFALIVFLPFLVRYKKKTIPYFVAFLSHSIIGDIYFTGIQLFWPFSTDRINFFSTISIRGGISVVLELVFFVVSITVMILNKDFQKLFANKKNRIYWLIPFLVVLGPLLIGQINPDYYLPRLLIVPSLFYTAIFSYLIVARAH